MWADFKCMPFNSGWRQNILYRPSERSSTNSKEGWVPERNCSRVKNSSLCSSADDNMHTGELPERWFFSWAIQAHDGWAWATPKSSEMIVLLLYLHHFCSEELVFCGSQFVICSVDNMLHAGECTARRRLNYYILFLSHGGPLMEGLESIAAKSR